MSTLFAWHSLVFLIPLVVAIALVCAAACGAVDLDPDADVDVEADVDLDADAEAGGDAPDGADSSAGASSLLELLGIGRIPLTLVVITLLLCFGGFGLTLKAILVPFGLGHDLAGLLAVGLAGVGALSVTGTLARLAARLLPSTETYATQPGDLVGRLGKVEVEVTPSFGIVHVTSADGTLHQIRCRSDERRLVRGTPVLVIDYDADTSVFDVARSPL